MPLPWPEIISSLGQIGGQAINAASVRRNNLQQQAYNMRMYNLQRGHALADWEMQNLYNSPAAQMSRLRAAGLNPFLMYKGGADTGLSGNVRGTEAKPWNPMAPQVDPNTAGTLFQQWMNLKKGDAVTDNLKIQQALNNQKVLESFAKTANIMSSTALNKFQLEQKNRLKDIVFDTAIANAENLRAQAGRNRANELYTLTQNEIAKIMTEPNVLQAWQTLLNSKLNAFYIEEKTLLTRAQTAHSKASKDYLLEMTKQVRENILRIQAEVKNINQDTDVKKSLENMNIYNLNEKIFGQDQKGTIPALLNWFEKRFYNISTGQYYKDVMMTPQNKKDWNIPRPKAYKPQARAESKLLTR